MNKETVKILQKVGVSNIQVSIEPTEILDSLNRPIKNTNKSIVGFVEKLKNDNLFFNKVNFALDPLHIPYLNSQLDYAILNDIFDSR
ncbi:MAG: hypothetical protein Ta2C_08700 [Candidatus Endomicrobiellum trichonymphae]|uniref:hypothetical protein n=1 Tax=Endomicrobium trichonymphae TaxID=1408204 RepID=UPI0027D3A27A|nr:MAG: hypothetical protein Ta2C_08700 [Candidatus Endomicrobium trichonymphae]